VTIRLFTNDSDGQGFYGLKRKFSEFLHKTVGADLNIWRLSNFHDSSFVELRL
jgi:hypothetical protein